MQREVETRRGPWARIAELAAGQHGVVSIEQLRRAGFRDGAIRHRALQGQLHPLLRGTYAVGHPGVSERGRWMAAVLACGEGAFLSHRSAAALWGLLPSGRVIEVTAPRHLDAPAEVRVHQCGLAAGETALREGIPVTAVPRTLIDVAAAAPHLLTRAITEAEVQRLTEVGSLERAIRANRGRRGVARLRACLPRSAPLARSGLERRFLDLLDRAGIQPPETGVILEVGSELLECDCLWRESRVMVELDGGRFHRTAAAFERDRARDRMLAAAGWQVIRVTWGQLHSEPTEILRDLRTLLSRASGFS